jgi:hypothetical protein
MQSPRLSKYRTGTEQINSLNQMTNAEENVPSIIHGPWYEKQYSLIEVNTELMIEKSSSTQLKLK